MRSFPLPSTECVSSMHVRRTPYMPARHSEQENYLVQAFAWFIANQSANSELSVRIGAANDFQECRIDVLGFPIIFDVWSRPCNWGSLAIDTLSWECVGGRQWTILHLSRARTVPAKMPSSFSTTINGFFFFTFVISDVHVYASCAWCLPCSANISE